MQVDARGKTCPQPVIMTMKALRELAQADGGDALGVLVDERVAVENLMRLAASRGCVASVEERDGYWLVSFPPEAATAEASEPIALAAERTSVAPVDEDDVPPAGIACPAPTAHAAAGSPATVLVGRSVLGRGDDELGAVLMRGVLYAMSQRDEVPRRMIFYNSGAYLTGAGSASLEDIRELERRGTEVLTCGTCLDYLGIKDELAVGGITNLYVITEAMLESGHVVML